MDKVAETFEALDRFKLLEAECTVLVEGECRTGAGTGVGGRFRRGSGPVPISGSPVDSLYVMKSLISSSS